MAADSLGLDPSSAATLAAVSTLSSARGLLVGPKNAFQPGGGGVQMAIREHVAVLESAGFLLRQLAYEPARTVQSRIRNWLRPRVVRLEPPTGLVAAVEAALEEVNADFVFFCANLFPQISRRIRTRFPEVRQVLLSVGVESIDFCIDQQLRRASGEPNHGPRRAASLLGRQVLDEAEQRGLIDAVITLSSLEAEVEKWLGAPRALWLPRTIWESPLNAHPVDGRVGCVSTLDHPPNRDGLLRIFEQLTAEATSNLRFRLVGGPRRHGEHLAARFPFVEYLGPLSDVELRTEAETWCCFV